MSKNLKVGSGAKGEEIGSDNQTPKVRDRGQEPIGDAKPTSKSEEQIWREKKFAVAGVLGLFWGLIGGFLCCLVGGFEFGVIGAWLGGIFGGLLWAVFGTSLVEWIGCLLWGVDGVCLRTCDRFRRGACYGACMGVYFGLAYRVVFVLN